MDIIHTHNWYCTADPPCVSLMTLGRFSRACAIDRPDAKCLDGKIRTERALRALQNAERSADSARQHVGAGCVPFGVANGR